MKTFYAGVFMDKELLAKEGIRYPIKLEYYKIENEENKFGIEVVKTKYQTPVPEVEKSNILEITNNEKKTNFILDKLKEGGVSPVIAKYVIEDLMKQNT